MNIENNRIDYLLSEEKKLEELLRKMAKRERSSMKEKEEYERVRQELADVRKRMNFGC